MKNYELVYLTPAGMPEEGFKSLQEKISSLVQGEGGSLIESNEPVKKGVSYLTALDFGLAPEKIAGLEGKLKLELKSLRHLVLIKHKSREGPVRRRRIFMPGQDEKKAAPKVELKEIEKKLEEILGE